jgi:hypothetical protein
MQLPAAIAHQPVRVAIFRHGPARSIPTARYNRVADNCDQFVGNLVPGFFETRRTSMAALAQQLSLFDVWHRRLGFNCLSEELRQFRSVLQAE